MWFFTAKTMELFSIYVGKKQQKNFLIYFFGKITSISGHAKI